ncbi:hypothetical protein [Methanoculleus chikugoensis]|uniref:hypothetical protein n=1 Tax=Methanoculleus chikugoensis TaxID=118126 RepID=UPI000A49C04B|nr:hypothetical protein [Methanoculleus chikugoensis]
MTSPPSRSCCPSCPETVQPASGPVQEIRTTDSRITLADRSITSSRASGVNRMGHRVEPGLYRLGNPTEDSPPVFVSANYTLSFDALRSALSGRDGYILVLDTLGINVWCAAGEGDLRHRRDRPENSAHRS